MAGKIILNADLYDNAVTERKGDYTAKPRITGTLRNEDIAERIVEKRTEYRKETIVNILTLADQEKVQAIAEGKSVVDGIGQYLINIAGSFEGEKAAFDPSVHKLGVTYTTGKLMRKTLKDISVETSTASTGPIINGILDSTTNERNGVLSSGSGAVIDGVNIKIAGESALNGVFFTKTGSTPKKITLLMHNNPSQLTVIMPAMEDGEYTLSITTQYASGNRLVKEPRSYILPVLLFVGNGGGGGGDDENPDIL